MKLAHSLFLGIYCSSASRHSIIFVLKLVLISNPHSLSSHIVELIHLIIAPQGFASMTLSSILSHSVADLFANDLLQRYFLELKVLLDNLRHFFVNLSERLPSVLILALLEI